MVGLSITYESPLGRQTEEQIDPTRIDLKMRAATKVNLEAVQGNNAIEMIELSKNLLESIDLTPLSECTKLEYIRLRSNRLRSLDLWPLMDLHLEEIDLVDNRFEQLNLTPLIGKCRILLDDSVKVTIDSVLRYLIGGKETTQIELCKPSGEQLKTSPRILWNNYSEIAKEAGWQSTNFNLLSLLESIDKRSWFRAQKGFLEGMGIPELAGLDSDPSILLLDMENVSDFNSAQSEIYDRTIELLEMQLEAGGPTLFLDANRMAGTRASKLIPLLAELREREMENVILPIGGNSVHLLPLWLTHYGMEILRVLRFGLTTDTKGFTLLKDNLERLGFNILTENIDINDLTASKTISEGVVDYVYTVASMNYTEDWISR